MPIILTTVAVDGVEVERGQRIFTPLHGMINTGKSKPGQIGLYSLPIALPATLAGSLWLRRCPCTRNSLGRRRVHARC